MITLPYIPSGIDEIREYYGDPAIPNFFDDHMKICYPPFPMRQSWDMKTITRFPAHKLIAPALMDALVDIEKYGGFNFLRIYNLDLWGGVYNKRNKRGGNDPSTHSWGIAIDYCPNYGPRGEPSRMPCFIVNAFERRGFVNLCRDGMHFQGCKNY